MGFMLITLGMVAFIILVLVLLARSYPGSGADLLDWKPTRDFETEVQGLQRVEQAVAFLALLELRKEGEISISQAAPFAPIRIARADARLDSVEDSDPDDGRMQQWTARSA